MSETMQSQGPSVPNAIPNPSKPQNVPFLITSAKASSKYLKMMIYGDFGTGKTTLASTAQDVPEMRDVLFIDAESGSMSIAHRDDIDVVKIVSYSQFARIHEFLRMYCKYRDAGDTNSLIKLEAMFKGLDPSQIKQPKMYRTVIVDSLTEVQKYCMYQLLGIKIGDHMLDLEPDSPQFQEWNKNAEMIRLLVRSFRNLAMNVIFVASRMEDQDEKKRMIFQPALPGKLANEVLGFLDVVGYYVAVPNADGTEIRRRLYLAPSPVFKAKNRFTNFKGTYLDDPTMSDIWNISKM